MCARTASIKYGFSLAVVALIAFIGQAEGQTTGSVPPLAGSGKGPDLVKPPFSATPLGQPLSPDVPRSDNAVATKTTNSKLGGYPGKTRSEETKYHYGLDDPGKDGNETTRFTGTEPGIVTKSGDAWTTDKKTGKPVYLGKRVEIEFQTKDGTWTSTTMHHKKVFVEKGQSVYPGQKIAEGKGYGDQFSSPNAGNPHVHWEARLNGDVRNPLDGTKVAGGYRPPSGQPTPTKVPVSSESGNPDMLIWACTEMRKQEAQIRSMLADPQIQAIYQKAQRTCEQGVPR